MTDSQARALRKELQDLIDLDQRAEKAQIRALQVLHGFTETSARKAYRNGLRVDPKKLVRRSTRVISSSQFETR